MDKIPKICPALAALHHVSRNLDGENENGSDHDSSPNMDNGFSSVTDIRTVYGSTDADYLDGSTVNCIRSRHPAAVNTSDSNVSTVKHGVVVGTFATIFGVAVMITVLVIYSSSGGAVPFDYGVIIDAGSTHTQALLYKWLASKDNGTGNVIQVAECTFEGGIAALPDPAVILKCVENVTKYIPDTEKAKSPLCLAATAGMRLLNITEPKLVRLMLLELKCALQNVGLYLQSVSVIPGYLEGVYSWITVNFLQNVLDPKNGILLQDPNYWKLTYGALDMGGASTQISFAVNTSNPTVPNRLVPLKLYGRKYEVFSKEFLCFGAVKAHVRHQALLIKNLSLSGIVKDPCLPLGNTTTVSAKSLLGGPCTVTQEFENWLNTDGNGAKNFTFEGTSDFEACQQAVENIVNETMCQMKGFSICAHKTSIPSEDMKFMAFSSFFYVTNFLNATNVTLPRFEEITQYWCNLTWPEVSRYSHDPKIFQHLTQYCFGAVYIKLWLTAIYGFNQNSWHNLVFQQEVDGTEVGWALGLMIDATNAIPAEKRGQPFFSTSILAILLVCCWLLIIAGSFLVYKYYKRHARCE